MIQDISQCICGHFKLFNPTNSSHLPLFLVAHSFHYLLCGVAIEEQDSWERENLPLQKPFYFTPYEQMTLPYIC